MFHECVLIASKILSLRLRLCFEVLLSTCEVVKNNPQAASQLSRVGSVLYIRPDARHKSRFFGLLIFVSKKTLISKLNIKSDIEFIKFF